MNNNMRKIFIIGNGFDLSLGYPTRFKDFIDFCENWKSFYGREENEKYAKTQNESNIDDMKLDEHQHNQWKDENMSKLKIFCDNTEKKYLERINYLINLNGIIKYLIERKIKSERWSDFENYILSLCEMCEEHEKQIIEYKLSVPNKYSTFQYNDEFYEFLEYVNIRDSFYSQNLPNNKNNLETTVRQDKSAFIKKLSEEIETFAYVFNFYLKFFVCKMKTPKWNNIPNDENVFILNFNYTNFCKNIFDKTKINYVHGYYEDDNIIIGINDEKLSSDYDCLRKKFLRLNLNVETKQINQKNLIGQYEEIEDYAFMELFNGASTQIPTSVYVIGHSLNKVDWDFLFKYFNNKSYNKIIIYYHKTYDSQLLNLYQMLIQNGVEYDVIRKRICNGYYSFCKNEDLEKILNDINTTL